MKYKPLNDQVLLKKLNEGEQRYGNIIKADIGNEKPIQVVVVAVGNGIYNYHTDKWIPHQVKVDDVVYMPRIGVQTLELNNEEHYICQANQLLLQEITE